jgi:hypothetical protein
MTEHLTGVADINQYRRCEMRVEHERCCGIDVHKETVVACVIVPDAHGAPVKETRTFSTMTGDCRRWGVADRRLHHVVMRVRVYWKRCTTYWKRVLRSWW